MTSIKILILVLSSISLIGSVIGIIGILVTNYRFKRDNREIWDKYLRNDLLI